MSALGRTVRAGIGRRRIQTLVVLLTTLSTVTAAILGASLLVVSAAPFDRAFAQQHGAQLTVRFDGAAATADRLAATAHAPGVTGVAGPFPVLTLVPQAGPNDAGMPTGAAMPAMTVVGRAEPGAAVDDLTLTDGAWATAPGQIVLNAKNAPMAVGDHIRFQGATGVPARPGVPGEVTLTVVGVARSVTGTADAWVSPAELALLSSPGASPGASPGEQMLYRFVSAATDAEVATDRAAITAAAPAGTVSQAGSYLPVRTASDRTTAPYVPFVSAFAVLGLAMSVLIVAIVVGGAVAAARRRIGLLKAVGFTPAQVVRAYVAQALVPATIGAALGLLAGNAAAVVVLGAAGRAYGAGTPSVPPWIDVAVPIAVLAAVATSALVPALRAGRLRSVEATAAGPAPGADRCRTVGRRLGALPLPRPLSLGLAAPFLRPARTATMTAAVALGAIGITFGLGLTLSLDRIQQGMADRPVGDVVVNAVGGPRLPRGAGEHHGRDGSTARFLPTPPAAASSPALAVDAAAHTGGATQDSIAAAIAGQPGTRRWFGTGQTHLGVAGLAGSTTVITFTGDSTWSPYQLVAGSWFHRPGEAVVPSGLLTTTGTHIGSTLTLTNNRRRTSVRIVGEVLDLQGGGLVVLTDLRSLTGLDAYELPASLRYDIDVTPGTDPTRYVRDLDTALAGTGAGGRLNHGGASNSVVLAMDALSWMLTLLLLATAGLGVLSTVVLDTRDRARELGVFKALGMTPRQTVAMVLTSVAGVGLVAGCLGVPIGTALHDLVLPAMGDSVGTRIPAADVAVYSPALFAVLVVAGVAVAVAGALLPASWAAHARTAVALRTE